MNSAPSPNWKPTSPANSSPVGARWEVHLTIPATTAAGLNNHPADIDGLPVTAQAARELLAEATSWRWIRTNPETGHVEDLTYPQYQPPTLLTTLVKVRDRTCRFPGLRHEALSANVEVKDLHHCYVAS